MRSRADALPEMAPRHVMGGPAAAGASFPTFDVARSALTAGFERLLLWQERARQRRQLSRVENHLLQDIGLTRAEVAREIKKPFWRP